MSDSNNIILWHESEDINLKSLFPKFQLIPILRLPSYAWLCVIHCFHRLLCWINSRVRDFSVKLLSFHTKMILAWFLWGIVFLRGELRKYAKKSSFENFESALYSTSVSIPLSQLLISGECKWFPWRAQSWGLPTDIKGRSQTSYTTPCNGIVSHGAQNCKSSGFCWPRMQ